MDVLVVKEEAVRKWRMAGIVVLFLPMPALMCSCWDRHAHVPLISGGLEEAPNVSALLLKTPWTGPKLVRAPDTMDRP